VATPQSSLASVGVVLWLKKGRAEQAEQAVLLLFCPISSAPNGTFNREKYGKMIIKWS
jgi:hypothetical protein